MSDTWTWTTKATTLHHHHHHHHCDPAHSDYTATLEVRQKVQFNWIDALLVVFMLWCANYQLLNSWFWNKVMEVQPVLSQGKGLEWAWKSSCLNSPRRAEDGEWVRPGWIYAQVGGCREICNNTMCIQTTLHADCLSVLHRMPLDRMMNVREIICLVLNGIHVKRLFTALCSKLSLTVFS